ncbi:MAG: ABC transporter permease [Gemmatimonadota bacterium]|jgi:predicted permease
MNRTQPLPVRVYAALLRRMVPSLDPAYAEEAVELFRAMGKEAWTTGLRATMAFAWRETHGLVRSFLSECPARRRARREEQSRSTNPGIPAGGGGGKRPFLEGARDILSLDLRYALRNLARTPGFVIVSVLSLTFGIGVSTGLFTLVNAVLFRPLPLAEEPEELVRVFTSGMTYQNGPLSFPDFLDLKERIEAAEDMAAVSGGHFALGSASDAGRPVVGLKVSENYFDVLGIRMSRGRGFLPEDIAAGGRVAVIGYPLWQDRFGGDPGALGQTLSINGKPFTVIGVAPEGMVGVQEPTLVEVVIPTMEFREERGRASMTGVARLRDGATIEQLQAELDAVALQLREEHPDYWASDGLRHQGLSALTFTQAMLPPGEAGVVLVVVAFLSVVGLILLIACSNVANLLLTRAWKRRGEVAIRAAIGASSRRILVQLLTENLILFGLAGLLSLFLVHWLTLMAANGASFLPPGRVALDLDWRVVTFVVALVCGSGLTFGLLPVLHASRPDLIPALKGREAPPKHRLLGVRNLLVGAQVGGSLVLVLVSLLLVQSLSHASRLDLGFDPDGVAIVEVDLSHREYGEAEGRQLLADLMERTGTHPGVTGTALAARIPLEGGSTILGGIEPEGYEPAPNEYLRTYMNVVTPGYLELMGVRLLRGRDLSSDDVADGEKVILVSQAFVDRFWPRESGVGKRINSGERQPYSVVGVVDDIPWHMPGEEPEPAVWIPFSQSYQPRMILQARTTGDPGALLPVLREEVARVDAELPILRLSRMESITDNATLLHRMLSAALGVAGLITLALAMLGIYGVVAFSVSQRTREVGLRMALGAKPDSVVRMVVREGVQLALIGLVPGLLISAGAALLMRAALLGLQPLDPLAFAGSVSLLLLSVGIASLGPARRAARCHPMTALREE